MRNGCFWKRNLLIFICFTDMTYCMEKNLEQKIREADGFLQKGNAEKALRILKKCRKTNPADPLIHYNLGVLYYSLGRYDKSAEALQAAVRMGGREPDMYNQLGLAFDRTGDRKRAVDSYHKALEIDPEFSSAWNNLGVLFFLAGQYSTALSFFRNALKFDAENPDTWYNYRDTCRELGLYDEAERADAQYRMFVEN